MCHTPVAVLSAAAKGREVAHSVDGDNAALSLGGQDPALGNAATIDKNVCLRNNTRKCAKL